MVLDPLTVIGLVGNIVQFVDFSSKLVAGAHQIYKSTDGSLSENIDAEVVAKDLLNLNSGIQFGLEKPITKDDQALRDLCQGCNEIAQKLLTALGKLKSQGKKGKWKSVRQALKSSWSRDDIEAIQKRLAGFREELELRIIIGLREKIDLIAILQAEGFNALEKSTRDVVIAILNNRSAFESVTETQTIKLAQLHALTNSVIGEEHQRTRAKITDAMLITNDQSHDQHEKTRKELTRMAAEASTLKKEMEQQLTEIKALILATGQAKGPIQQMQLKERTDAVSAAWIAKDLMYVDLVGYLESAAAMPSSRPWNITPYPKQRLTSSRGLSRPVSVLNGGLPDRRRTTDNELRLQHLFVQSHQAMELQGGSNTPCFSAQDSMLSDNNQSDDGRSRALRFMTPGACTNCKESRAKCDNRQPECGSCTSKSLEATCRYGKSATINIVNASEMGGSGPDDNISSQRLTLGTSFPGPNLFYSTSDVRAPNRGADGRRGISNSDTLQKTALINSLIDMGCTPPFDDIPLSFQMAISNRFTPRQVHEFSTDLELAFSHPRPVFCFGSTMWPAIIRCLTTGTTLRGIAKCMTPATIHGYNRHEVRSAGFPGLVPSMSAKDEVKGMVLFGLHDSQRRRLHKFQNGMYDLKKDVVEIELCDGTKIAHEAGVYVWNRGMERLIPLWHKIWSPSEFMKTEFYRNLIVDFAEEEDALIATSKVKG